MKITEKIFDILTNETTFIERDMTDAELAQLEIDNKKAEQETKILAEKNIKRQALLSKLGITEEEAKLLLS
jgi:hypothetical protein